MYYTIILYVYIYIPLYCSCGKPTGHTPPGQAAILDAEESAQKLGTETVPWVIGSCGAFNWNYIFQKKKDLFDPIDS